MNTSIYTWFQRATEFELELKTEIPSYTSGLRKLLPSLLALCHEVIREVRHSYFDHRGKTDKDFSHFCFLVIVILLLISSLLLYYLLISSLLLYYLLISSLLLYYLLISSLLLYYLLISSLLLYYLLISSLLIYYLLITSLLLYYLLISSLLLYYLLISSLLLYCLLISSLLLYCLLISSLLIYYLLISSLLLYYLLISSLLLYYLLISSLLIYYTNILQSILAKFNTAVVGIVRIFPTILCYAKLFSKPLWTVQRALITVGISVTFRFHRFSAPWQDSRIYLYFPFVLLNCYGDISFYTPKMDSSNLNLFSELAHSGTQLLLSYETFDRGTASREQLVLLLYDFLQAEFEDVWWHDVALTWNHTKDHNCSRKLCCHHPGHVEPSGFAFWGCWQWSYCQNLDR